MMWSLNKCWLFHRCAKPLPQNGSNCVLIQGGFAVLLLNPNFTRGVLHAEIIYGSLLLRHKNNRKFYFNPFNFIFFILLLICLIPAVPEISGVFFQVKWERGFIHFPARGSAAWTWAAKLSKIKNRTRRDWEGVVSKTILFPLSLHTFLAAPVCTTQFRTGNRLLAAVYQINDFSRVMVSLMYILYHRKSQSSQCSRFPYWLVRKLGVIQRIC